MKLSLFAVFAASRDSVSRRSQLGRRMAVNRELVMLYWDIGRGIVEKQNAEGWGESVVERLSTDLRAEFPNMRGFSGRNLRDMRRFFLAYTEDQFWRQAVAKLTSERGAKFVLEQAVPEKGVCSSTT